jgi:hypothetical protein
MCKAVTRLHRTNHKHSCVFNALQGTSSAKLPAGTSGCSLTVSLTYYGRDARGKSAATRTLAAAINAPDGECKYGVCTAIKSASKGAATVASAEANTTKTFADGAVKRGFCNLRSRGAVSYDSCVAACHCKCL